MSDMNSGTVTQPGGYPLGDSFSAQCRVPALVGLSSADAEAKLGDYHLALGTVTEVEDAENVDTVTAQGTATGTLVDAGTEIDITVGIEPAPPPGP